MQWVPLGLLVLVGSSCAVAKQQPAGDGGISQFWTDDYKVFDQIYGKTSDKELFGATLPPSLSFGIEEASKLKKEASEKKERYLERQPSGDDDPYNYGARYPSQFANQALKKLVTKKPKKTATKFIPSNFKPIISKDTDPETYNYLKHLELLAKQKEQFSQINVGGFKPYLNYAGPNAEDTEGFKSIQDILEAHEANKGRHTENEETDDQVKYLTYGNSGRGKGRGQVKKTKPRPPNTKGKPSCTSGHCRKRATNTFRGRTYLTRPYVRKIKHKIIKY